MKTPKDFYIITGASKGLGSALAIEVSNKNTTLLLISRDENKLASIAQQCLKKGAIVFTIIDDITNDGFSEVFNKYLFQISSGHINRMFLINNASVIDPINKLFNINKQDQKNIIDVNLTATIWITSEFLRASYNFTPTETFVINISSGVSLKPISGWSLYCISKSGINMLTACVAEESADWNNKVYAVAINPGALDTDMQKKIRESNIQESPIADRFIKMHQDGKLHVPQTVAKKILNFLNEKEFVNGSFVDFNLL